MPSTTTAKSRSGAKSRAATKSSARTAKKPAASRVNPIPEGMHTVTPHLVCAGAADAIAFYQRAFGAVEMGRLPAPNGKIMHAAIRIGDSVVMLVDEFPEMGALGPKMRHGTSVTIHLYVKDVDASSARAIEAGAKVIMPVEDTFWGDRYGIFEDPFGHRWSIASRVRDLSLEEIAKAAPDMCG